MDLRSVFAYPKTRHILRHGPRGYTICRQFKPWLRDDFGFRCIYCLRRERWMGGGHSDFSVEPIPRNIAPRLTFEFSNLRYACSRCNSIRQDRRTIDPCDEPLSNHLNIRQDGHIEGLTPDGVAHIKVLRLDHPALTEYRARFIRAVGLLEAKGAWAEINAWLGYPDDLPNLAALKTDAETGDVLLKEYVVRAKRRVPKNTTAASADL